MHWVCTFYGLLCPDGVYFIRAWCRRRSAPLAIYHRQDLIQGIVASLIMALSVLTRCLHASDAGTNLACRERIWIFGDPGCRHKGLY